MDVVSVLGLVTFNVVGVVSVICELLNLSPSSTCFHFSERLGKSWVYVREHLLGGMRDSKGYLKEVTTFVFVFLILNEVFGESVFNVVVSTKSTVVFPTKDLFGSGWIWDFWVYPITTGFDSWVCEDIPR